MENFELKNRRYLGNKYKLLSFINDVVINNCKEVNIVADIFSGTGSFCSLFKNKIIITNDILYSNYMCNVAWYGAEKVNKKKIENIIEKINNNKKKQENYMTKNFSNTYFDKEGCYKIGFAREYIEKIFINKEINFREKAILITSLIYAMDSVANTCGHYDSYIKNQKEYKKIILKMLSIDNDNNKKNKCFNEDANELVKKVYADLIYIDPPYNSRQYCDAYHLLENVSKWEKPTVYGVAKKMNRENIKSKYCTNEAPEVFKNLIEKINAKYILVSYNDTAKKLNDRSNAKITDDEMLEILNKKGKIKIFSYEHKLFNAGKTKNIKNQERLFLCEVY